MKIRRLVLLVALAAAGALAAALVARPTQAASGLSLGVAAIGTDVDSSGNTVDVNQVDASWTLAAGDVVCSLEATSPSSQVMALPPHDASRATISLTAAGGTTIDVRLAWAQTTPQIPDPDAACANAQGSADFVVDASVVAHSFQDTATTATVTVTTTTATTTTDVLTTTDVTTTTDPQTATALDQAIVGQTVHLSQRLWKVTTASRGSAHLLARKKRRAERRRPRRVVPSKVAAAHVVHPRG